MKRTQSIAIAGLLVTALFGCGDDPASGGTTLLLDATGDTGDLGVDVTGEVGAQDVDSGAPDVDSGVVDADAGGADGDAGPTECDPGSRACEDGGVITCDADGAGWSTPVACDSDETCVEGVCIGQSCEPGERVCGPDRVLECNDDGITWNTTICEAGRTCYLGECIACLSDEACDVGTTCLDGECVPALLRSPSSPSRSPTRLSRPPTAPRVIELAGDGSFSGTPTARGEYPFTV